MEPTTGTLTTLTPRRCLAGRLAPTGHPAGRRGAAGRCWRPGRGLGGINTQPGGPTAGGGGYGGASGAGVPQTGLIGAESALQGGLRGGLAGIEARVNQAGQTLSPYTQGGNQAFGLQSALSGAMGPEAQRQAFANYNESPEVAYQREMGERAITRNAAATGGLGGGRVQQELQRHAIGLAQQDYGNSFNRLGPSPRRVTAPPDCWAGYRPTPGALRDKWPTAQGNPSPVAERAQASR